MLNTTDRTMKIHGGWASKADNSFRGMDYASNFVRLYDDKNWTQYNETVHPQMNGIFFYDRHPQPSNDPCMANVIRDFYG
jgi:hypothetical protein